MKKLENITVNVLYVDDQGGIWRFDTLVKGKGFISPADLDEESFAHSIGGLELITNRHFIFYRSTDFYDLELIINFLLNSLALLDNDLRIEGYGNYTLKDETVSEVIHTNGSILRLKRDRADSNIMEISFSDNSTQYLRNDFSFNEIYVSKEFWIGSVRKALEEYFVIVDMILTKFPNRNGDFLRALSKKWHQLFDNSPSR